ncbi:MAG: Helix-turn-helix protein CopG [Ramlibacter sp.]|nr:Helix-turn-helix protein CopG [Ramlibacter sp.]
MEKKTARLTVLMDPARKSAFEALCRSQDLTPSQVMRQLIREFIAQNAPAGRAVAKKPRR